MARHRGKLGLAPVGEGEDPPLLRSGFLQKLRLQAANLLLQVPHRLPQDPLLLAEGALHLEDVPRARHPAHLDDAVYELLGREHRAVVHVNGVEQHPDLLGVQQAELLPEPQLLQPLPRPLVRQRLHELFLGQLPVLVLVGDLEDVQQVDGGALELVLRLPEDVLPLIEGLGQRVLHDDGQDGVHDREAGDEDEDQDQEDQEPLVGGPHDARDVDPVLQRHDLEEREHGAADVAEPLVDVFVCVLFQHLDEQDAEHVYHKDQ
mmetsp:Transcript_14363/g.40925  ORF Transcript_14363/g.40925 Transcript_14363/m.40925 type:complete len:262 (-) Transcript_14363:847-1632(-)